MEKTPLAFRRILPGILLFLSLAAALPLGSAAMELRGSLFSFLPVTTGIEQSSRGDATHLLLVSLDQPEQEAPVPDSIVLLSIQHDAETMRATAVCPDLCVDIPGQGNDALYTAYTRGGLPLLRQTVEDTLSLELAGCIAVDFSQLSQLVDAQEGIVLTLDVQEAQAINELTGGSLCAGQNRLDGQQAMAYWRLLIPGQEKTAQADRQKNMVSAFWRQHKGSGLGQVTGLLKDLTPILHTDMKQTRLLTLALEIFPILSRLQVTSHQLPGDGTCTQQTPDGKTVVTASPQLLQQQLTEILQGSTDPAGR